MAATTAPTTLVHDFGGALVVADGIVYRLTACCAASGKGSSNSPTGVCCRACYRPVPAELGDGWLVSDAAAWERYAAALLASGLAGGAADTAENRALIARLTAMVAARAAAA